MNLHLLNDARKIRKLEVEVVRLRLALEEAAPDWIGDCLADIEECLRDCTSEFAIRLFRARRTLDGTTQAQEQKMDENAVAYSIDEFTDMGSDENGKTDWSYNRDDERVVATVLALEEAEGRAASQVRALKATIDQLEDAILVMAQRLSEKKVSEALKG